MLSALLLVGLPLANLAWKCGVLVLQTEAGRQRYWSLVKCVTIVAASPLRFGREIRSSLIIGSASATAAVALGAMLAWWSRGSHVGRAWLVSVIVMGLAVPGPVVGLLIIRALNTPDWSWAHTIYDRTILPPIFAQVLRALPVVCLVLWHAFHSLPSELTEAAALDGANRWMSFRHVALSQRRFAIVAAWLMAFAVAVGELGATILVTPPGVETLAVRISGLLHYGVEDQVAGICLALALAFVVSATATVLLANRWIRAGRGTHRH